MRELMVSLKRRPWLAGAAVALTATLGLAGCDLSSLTGGTQCTPQTCDYVVNSLVAIPGASGVTLLADSANSVYQYDGSKWNKVGAESAQARQSLIASPTFATDQTVFQGDIASNDGGKTFHAICTTVIAVSPNFAQDKTVFGKDAGTSAETTNGAGTKVPGPTGCPSSQGAYYISKDSGATWTAVQGPQGAGDPDPFFVSPGFKTDKTIFATFTINGVTALYKTSNGGQSWSKSLDNRQGIVAISPNFASDQTVISVANDQVSRSTDGGATWQKLTAPIDAATVKEIAFSPTYTSDQTVILVSAAVDKGSTVKHGTFISKDGGQSWTQQNADLTQRGQNYPAFVFSPNYAQDKTVYTASLGQGQGPAMSTDLGQTWTPFATGLDLQSGLGG